MARSRRRAIQRAARCAYLFRKLRAMCVDGQMYRNLSPNQLREHKLAWRAIGRHVLSAYPEWRKWRGPERRWWSPL